MPRRGDDFGPGGGLQISTPRLTPVVKSMLIALLAALIAQAIQYWLVSPKHDVTRWLTLAPSALFRGQVWRLVTYPLVLMAGPSDPAAISELLWGGVTLWFFGTALETALGASRFVLFVAACVVLPALIASLIALTHPVFFVQPVNGPTHLSLALTAAWGTRFPQQRLFFPPVSGRTLVLVVLGIQVLMVLVRAPQQSIALPFASIGAGWLLMRYWDRIDDFLDRKRQQRVRAKRQKGLVAIQGGRDPKGDKRFLN